MRRLAAVAVLVTMLLALFVNPLTGQAQTPPGPSLDLSPCKFSVGFGGAAQPVDAQCGILQVPEDRSRPDGRQVDLHVTVLPATGAIRDKRLPIFHLEGGPGASAIQSFGLAWYGPYRTLRLTHDIVLIDQRGTGQSASLQCTEISETMLADLAKPIGDDNQKSDLERIQACLMRLSATHDPAFYTSTIMADDTDAVRAALGYDQIDLFGNSYGTWLGQIYLGRHGQHVHAMVLDSVLGPWDQSFLNSADSFQASLDKVFALCQSDAACNKAYPNLSGSLQKALDSLTKQPVTTSAPGVITGQTYTVVMTPGRLLDTIQQALYQSAVIGVIPQLISQASTGNYTLAATVLVAIEEQLKDVSWGLYYSVICSESVPFLSGAQLKPPKPTGFFAAANTAEGMNAICKAWRSAELDAKDVAPVQSDRPVLILSGAFDPATPVSFAEETHKRLTHSTLAVFPYQAHGPMAGSKCAQNMAAAFFTAPDQPVDTRCVASDIRPVFMGAYQVRLVPYADPNGAFQVNIPQGWQVDTKTSTGPFTFFASPDGVQLLGIGIFQNSDLGKAQNAALDAIRKAYGAVDIQVVQSLFIASVIQHTLDRPDEAYMGMLLLWANGSTVTAVWQAAPNNIFQSVVLPIAVPVFASLIVK